MTDNNSLMIYILISYLVSTAFSACNIGVSDVNNYNNNIEDNTGYHYVIPASASTCCGVLSDIRFYPIQTGEIIFHVWRPVSLGSYELTGKYVYFNSYANDTVNFSVDQSISVRTNDIIGWYTAGTDQIPYNTGTSLNQENLLLSGFSQLSEGYSLTVSTPYVVDRTYAIRYSISDSNSPSFTSWTSSITIYDTTAADTVIHQLSATDPNDQDNSFLTFNLRSASPNNPPFSVDSDGAIKTTTVPSSGAYQLTVKVRDPCNKDSQGTLTVSVLNMQPQFLNLPSSVDVQESTSVETLLYNISVIDQSGNDTVSCSITSTTPTSAPFIVKYRSGTSEYGIYLLANPNLDHSTTSEYTLTIGCTDTKDTTSVDFNVFVLQSDPPKFHNLPATITISSNTAVGTVIYEVKANDTEGDSLTYSVAGCSNCVIQITQGGQIIMQTSIASAQKYSYAFYIRVTDGSTTSQEVLAVIVNDVNNVPVLSNLDNTIYVMETATVGSTVFTLTATDIDVSDVLTYQLTYNPALTANKFAFDQSNGAVTLIEAIDYESNLTQFAITFDATDGKNAATPGTLTINVLDINEPPEFDRAIYYTTNDECCNNHEFSVPGYTVTDPDGDTFHYDFATGSDDHHRFGISSTTGRIRYRVDYDIDSPTNMPADLIFIIGAVDSRGQTGTTSLVVTITDRSEHSPEFAESLYSTTIYNDHQISSSVFYVTAADKDYGPTCNALTYILFGQTDYFAISNSGLLRTTTSLESFKNDTVLSFVVQSTDGCGLSTNVSGQVTIIPGTTTSFFDNPSNIAIVVGCFGAAGLLIVGIAFAVYRMIKHGYVFRKESCFQRSDSDGNSKKVKNPKVTKVAENYKPDIKKKRKLPSPEIHRSDTRLSQGSYTSNNSRLTSVSPMPWKWDDWRMTF